MANITHISQLDISKSYTYADYLTWWFEERVELIKGFIRKMSPAPSLLHQQISMDVSRIFSNFLIKKRCKVFHAPFDVRLNRNLNDSLISTVVQPDICIVCNPDILEKNGCNGAPDIIIEILSLKNSKHDLVTKFNLYEEAGVGEYWIVYPYEGVIDVYHLQNGKYFLYQKYTNGDEIEVKTLPGLVINMDDIFYEDVI